MPRFFVDPALLVADSVTLTGDLAHQLGRVLRLRPGDSVTLLDGSGWAWDVTLTTLDRHAVQGRVEHRYQPRSEPRLPIALYQALPKGKKLDLILQKATELGVSSIVPMSTRYAVVQGRGGDEHLARWRRIIQEAAEQSGRARLPVVHEPVSWDKACQPPAEHTLGLIACLHDEAQPLRQFLAAQELDQVEAVSLYVGPEGGFAPEEVAQAAASGIIPVSLGPRTLRTETAPLALLAVLGYAFGEMG